jgi:chromosome segregation ATPase
MAETKKRFRPTLTAYRAQENEISQLKEELSKLEIKYKTLLKSNELLEQERDRNHQALSNMSKQNKLLYNELQAIKSRGFWKRLFNLK